MNRYVRLQRTVAWAAAILLAWLPLAGADDAAIKTRLRDLHAKAKPVRIELVNGTKIGGSLVRLDADTFTVVDEETRLEQTVAYAQVARVKGKGLSRSQKAVLIPAVIGGSVLLVLCAAQYPIGHLCRKDPS